MYEKLTGPHFDPFIKPDISIQKLAEFVVQLSDFYISKPNEKTLWSKEFCQAAYRHYFLPLNYIRNKRVVQNGQSVRFFENIENFVDWGCGPGTASLAIQDQLPFKKLILIDQDLKSMSATKNHWDKIPQCIFLLNAELSSLQLKPEKSLLMCSYSLTEKNELPAGWNQFEALMILEPATTEDGRKLLQLRKLLIDAGYFIWAPCVHQKNCPLLTHSKHDWCHDRAHVDAPDWFGDLESKLPMKNKTVTTSYLLARKTPPLPAFQSTHQWRLIGDQLVEKGKTRQLVCRSEEREFLSWLHKDIKPTEIYRGDFFQPPAEYELISNEIRLKK